MKEGKTLEKEAVETAFKDSKYSVRSFKKEGEEKKEEKTDGDKKEGDGK